MMAEIVLVQKAVSKVFGDFVSKVVSDGVDALKSAIKKADSDRKSYDQNLQTRLYQLIVDALNRFTYNKYEKQDKLYDATENIIKGYISNKDNTDAAKSGLKMLVSGVDDDTCQEFLEILCGEICKNDNSDLYKEFDMLWKKRDSEYFRGEFAKIDQNDREILEQLIGLNEVLDFIKRNMNRQEGDKPGHNGIPIVNRADEYAKKWSENVFLNNFNEEDENAGVNIKLSDIYIEECLPHYIWGLNKQSKDTLRDFLAKYVININGKKMLLILGQPGIGKSTLITWMMANIVEKEEDILVYQFASDLGSVDWQGNNLLDEISSTIGLKYNELEGKSLILDGFDEIYVKEDRERILYKLMQELEKKNYLEKLSLIITCRENYVDKLKLKGLEYITLQVWDETQIRSFCETYEEVLVRKDSTRINKDLEINKITEKKDIMGIPLILYMVLDLNVDIERSSSIVDIYDQIFSLKSGGIYDRDYDIEHRINDPVIKESIHHISQMIAFWMFENNAGGVTISQEKFEEICKKEIGETVQKNNDLQGDTLIGNFFRVRHCEGKGTNEIQFVHRSIYEYFVVIYFFEAMHGLKSGEEVAWKLGAFLKEGRLSKQILEFVKYKFDSMKGCDLADITKEVFIIMLRDGMTYYYIKEQRKPLLNIIDREMRVFSNMLEVVHLWNLSLGKVDNKIVSYLQCNRENDLNLGGADLSGADLSGAKLSGADLSGAKLSGADLSGAKLSEADLSGAKLSGAKLNGAKLNGAKLSGADLSEADLSGTNLIGADLSEADLSGADLKDTDLRNANLIGADLSETNLNEAYLNRANLSGADLRRANLNDIYLFETALEETLLDKYQVESYHKKMNLENSRVYISESKEIVSYREYCIRKQKE